MVAVNIVFDDENVASELRVIRIFDESQEHDAIVFAWKRALALQGAVVRTEVWDIGACSAGSSREYLAVKLRREWGAPKLTEILAALENGVVPDVLQQYCACTNCTSAAP